MYFPLQWFGPRSVDISEKQCYLAYFTFKIESFVELSNISLESVWLNHSVINVLSMLNNLNQTKIIQNKEMQAKPVVFRFMIGI